MMQRGEKIIPKREGDVDVDESEIPSKASKCHSRINPDDVGSRRHSVLLQIIANRAAEDQACSRTSAGQCRG